MLPLSAFFLGLLPCCVSTLSLLYVPCVTNCILAFAWLSQQGAIIVTNFRSKGSR